MKNLYYLFLLIGVLSLSQCKKSEDEGKYGQVSTIILNDTLRINPSVGFKHSFGLDFDGVSTGSASDNDYHLTAVKNSSGENQLLLYACDYNLLLVTENDLSLIQKYEVGDVIDSENSNYTQSNQCNDAVILDSSIPTSFSLNSTAYVGLAYDDGGSFYYGWIKIKTLNDYESCVIVSYSVCKTSGLPVKVK